MLDLIAIFIRCGDRCREDEVFKNLAETQAGIDQQDIGNVPIGGEMIGQMGWHRAPIIRDEDEIKLLTSEQYRWIERAKRWRTRITNAPDNQIRRLPPKCRE